MVGATATAAQLAGAALTGCGAQSGAGMAMPEPETTPPTTLLNDWARAAAACHAAGEVCLAHCLRLLASGNTSMGECGQKAHAMLAICGAVGPIAASNSPHARQLAALCKLVCEECLEACAPHRNMHAECGACASACEATMAAAAAFLA